MKNNFPIYIDQEIDAYYQRVKNLLLAPSSYEEDTNLDNIPYYLLFVSRALKSNYEKTMHIFFFAGNDEAMCSSMYPFCNLKREAIHEIEALYSMSVWISDGMEDYKTSVLGKQDLS